LIGLGLIFIQICLCILKPQEETDPEFVTENPRYRNYPEVSLDAIEQIHTEIAQPLIIPIIYHKNGIRDALTV